ncbi:cysteine hydrolase [Selenomonadales bacterium OttesenSCG-928-I06]|nr:cysteine hydrolase [Selenomonadales bacterium OttesenSCG-928-I06]
MNKALIVIDYTYDFIASDGALTCGEAGQKIEMNIVNQIKKFAHEGQYIVIANDIHNEKDIYHPENKLFPPHNLKDSKGRELYGKVKNEIDSLVLNSANNIYFLDKTRYSAFAATDLTLRLRERKINEVYLVGVCTDICVLHTAMDAYNNSFDIVIPKDCVASFNQIGHDWALAHFQNTLAAKVI